MSALRYKMSQRRKPMILLSELPLRQAPGTRGLNRATCFLIGSTAHIVGTPLQDDIVRTTDHLLRLGQTFSLHSRRRRQRRCNGEPVVIDYETFAKTTTAVIARA